MEKSIKILFISILISFSSFSQQKIENLLDVVKVGMTTEKIVENLYDYSIIKEPMHLFGIDSESNGITIAKNGEKLLFLWSKYNSNNIYEIVVLNAKVIVDGKIKIGSTLEEFLEIYPNAKIEQNPEYENVETAYSEKSNYSVEFIDVNGKKMAEYNSDLSLKRILNMKSKIDRIKLGKNSG